MVALPEAVLVEKAKILGRLDAMKALGIGLALEGFGSGYATCARLKSLPVDLACIDGVLIQTLSRSTGRPPARAHSHRHRPASRHRDRRRMGGR